MNILSLVMLSVFINSAAQLLLKQGMNRIGHFDFTWANVLPISLQVALNPYIVGGLFCYVMSVAVWLLVLSRAQVSYAYPLISIGYIITAVAGCIFFNDTMSLTRVFGIFVIMTGVYLITRS